MIMNKPKMIFMLIITTFLLASCSNHTPKTDAEPLTNESSYEASTNTGIQADNNSSQDLDITQNTKEYILNGQGELPEAGKLKWSESFLDQVNIDDVYKQYLADGGTEEDIQSFAEYLTANAPIPENWQDLFAKDLLNEYNQKISHMEHLEGDLYQAYVIIEGQEVPYVVVNARTGYFHG